LCIKTQNQKRIERQKKREEKRKEKRQSLKPQRSKQQKKLSKSERRLSEALKIGESVSIKTPAPTSTNLPTISTAMNRITPTLVTPGTPFHFTTVQPTHESAPKFAEMLSEMLSEMQQKQVFQSMPSLSLQDYSLQVPTSAENTPLAYENYNSYTQESSPSYTTFVNTDSVQAQLPPLQLLEAQTQSNQVSSPQKESQTQLAPMLLSPEILSISSQPQSPPTQIQQLPEALSQHSEGLQPQLQIPQSDSYRNVIIIDD